MGRGETGTFSLPTRYFLLPHSPQNLAEAGFLAPQSVQNQSEAGLGEPHSAQNLPVLVWPQAQIQLPPAEAAGLGEPHSAQNFPVLEWPQEQVHAPAVGAGSAARRASRSRSICCWLEAEAAPIKPPPAFMPIPMPIKA